MRVLDLFSGIGGFSLGLERAGMKTVAFCEIEPYCRAVLKKHWPDVHCYEDVHDVGAARLAADGIGDIDVICGGFPCQDISLAGKGAGLAGERSGLWREYHRIIAEVQPRYAIIENVSALRSRGLDEVLRSLFEIGYDAEWHCIPASAVGAPHRRDRIWIIAHRNSDRDREPAMPEHAEASGLRCDVANAGSRRRRGANGWQVEQQGRTETIRPGEVVADPNIDPRHEWRARDAQEIAGGRNADRGSEREDDLANANGEGREGRGLCVGIGAQISRISSAGWWTTEPDVGRVAHGVPSRVDRLRALGNSVVPQIPEMIGRSIMEVAHA